MVSRSVTDLDRSGILRRMGQSQELLKQFVNMFFESYPTTLASIGVAIRDGDAYQLQESAHALKGVLQNFFVGALVEITYDLEVAGRDSILNDAPALYEALQAEFESITPLLEELRRADFS